MHLGRRETRNIGSKTDSQTHEEVMYSHEPNTLYNPSSDQIPSFSPLDEYNLIFAANASSQPEEPQHIVRLLGHRVPHALRKDSLKVGPVGRARVSRERVIRRVCAGALGVAEDVGPLLDLLVEVLRVERRVTRIVRGISMWLWRKRLSTHADPCQTCIFGRVPVKPE